jgi:death-on-curing protein
MSEPRWIQKRSLLFLHQSSLAAYGGSNGIRDEGLLDSALARPVNRYGYEPSSDIPALAASYAYGITKNHPFVDGNKRAAFAAAGTFLMLNGLELEASETDAISAMLSLSAGEISEEEFASWVRANCKMTG